MGFPASVGNTGRHTSAAGDLVKQGLQTKPREATGLKLVWEGPAIVGSGSLFSLHGLDSCNLRSGTFKVKDIFPTRVSAAGGQMPALPNFPLHHCTDLETPNVTSLRK